MHSRSLYYFFGEDLVSFFQGLLTKDVSALTSSIYACMLNAQGRFFCDFFITPLQDRWLIEMDAERQDEILKKLSLYRMRSRVSWTPQKDLHVCTSDSFIEGSFQDPRHAGMGYRFYAHDFYEDPLYEKRRLCLGIPEKELVPEKSIPLEYSLDYLHAISWTKGCYIGQELTARTYYLGMVRKRVFPIMCDLKFDIIMTDKREKAGKLLSYDAPYGLAMIRLEYAEYSLFCHDCALKVLPALHEVRVE